MSVRSVLCLACASFTDYRPRVNADWSLVVCVAVPPPQSLEKTPRTPRDKDGSILTEDNAARRIQGMGRHYIARRLIVNIVRQRFKKVYDESIGAFYIFDTVTGESTWEAPKLLRGRDLEETPRHEVPDAAAPRTPRWIAAELSEDEAARHIQGMFRAHQARKVIASIAKGVYTKVFDEASGAYYYFNTVTKESMWEKPKALERIGTDVGFHGAQGS